MSRFLCEPCDHRWWQHRHPDARLRFFGKVLMTIGAIQTGIGLILILR